MNRKHIVVEENNMIIVTGGAGFIGSCIVRTLNDAGIEDIVIVDNIVSTDKWMNMRNKKYLKYVNKHDFLAKLLEYEDVQAIIHMGACSSTTERNFDYLWNNNFEFTKALWNYCAEKQISFIYASSAATYGDGEQLGFSFQTNGSYYSSLSANYGTNWFGGKRPNSLNVGVFYSKQSDISSYYRNNAFYNNYAMYSYGYGGYNPYYYNYESMLDDDKTMTVFGASLGWGKRLRWPDDYFQFSAQLGFSRYMLRDWSYFYIHNGNCNNINLGFTLSRTSTDNQLFPRRGSEFMASVTVTPPWSLFDNKDYANLAKNSSSATYEDELQDVYRWIEYHKWKFKSRTFTALTGGQKCLVLMTRVEMGLLGSYNKDKRSPFETFYVGGDGMSGYSYGYSEETIGLRGYDNGALSYSSAYETMMKGGTISSYNSYAYDRFTLELRYPLMLGNTTIYGLGFVEGGNAWANAKDFNPFKMKRSAGIGVRIYLPMVGLMGIDWAYGFDNVYTNQSGAQKKGGSNFHFILGQEF